MGSTKKDIRIEISGDYSIMVIIVVSSLYSLKMPKSIRRVRKVLEKRGISVRKRLHITKKHLRNAGAYGAPKMIRTSDTRFRKPLLYPLSYKGITTCI